MQQLLEPGERVAVVEDDGRERAAVDLAVGRDDAVPHLLDDRLPHVLAPQQVMHDLVARDRRRAVARERAAAPRSCLPRCRR